MAIKDDEEYLKIEKLVMRYQDGDNEAGIEILELCKPFTDQYKNIICYGECNIVNPHARAFVSRFIPKDIPVRLGNYKKSSAAYDLAVETSLRIKNMFYMYEPDDIDNIIAVIILKLAKKYKNKGRNNFYAYLSSCFQYRLYDELIVLVKDMAHVAYTQGEEFHDNYIESATTDTYNIEIVSSAVAKLLVNEQSDEVGDNWLLGSTCEVFEYFTPLERKILLLKYGKKLSDEEVAEQLGVCRHTIFRRKIKLLKELDAYATSCGLLKG